MDKQVHRNEFRLRVLVTNACNANCKNCLNDFQLKSPVAFLDRKTLYKIGGDYYLLGLENPIITFSGGEPALHPDLWQMITYFDADQVKLVTRESALLQRHDYEDILTSVGELHVSVGEKISERTLFMLKDYIGEAVFQKIVYEDTSYEELSTLCYGELYPIKFFQDFYAPPTFDPVFRGMILRLREEYPDVDIRTRFTGVQENRGPGCAGCARRCVTLKGLWVFPDGTVSPCPQRAEFRRKPEGDYMSDAFEFHKA